MLFCRNKYLKNTFYCHLVHLKVLQLPWNWLIAIFCNKGGHFESLTVILVPDAKTEIDPKPDLICMLEKPFGQNFMTFSQSVRFHHYCTQETANPNEIDINVTLL